VFDIDGGVVGSISVCGPVDRFDDAAVARYLPNRPIGREGDLPSTGLG
jgi:DNA-binding IclR family transcriptional regulator